MTELALEIEMDISKYNSSIKEKIAEYMQDLDVFLAHYGVESVKFDFYNCEVLNETY